MQPFSSFPTVPGLLDARAEALGDAVFIRFEQTTCSYGEMVERVRRVHAWLRDAGVGPGDRVALFMDNAPELVYAGLAVARAGAISVPINTAMVGDSLAHVLEHSGAIGIFADAALLPAVDAAGELAELRWRVVPGGAAGAEPFEATLAAGSGATPDAAQLGAGSPMTIVYTSGTTGMPKGVVLPYGSYTNTGGYFAHHLGLTPEDRLHTCLPLFHCNAQQCSFMPALQLGTSLALDRRFSVSRFWDWTRDGGSTVTNLLGAMLTLLWKAPPADDDADNPVRLIAAAPIPPELHRGFEERFGLTLIEGYGLTETGTMACMNPLSDPRTGTIGLPLEHTELRIVGEDGADLPDEEPGEILVRSKVEHAMMLEYFKEPDKTAEAMEGGWFHTGDMGKRREDGYHVFLDRMKDTIRRRGENISSFMVEKTILDHPDVLGCAVFGVPAELSEEDVKVVAVLREGVELDPADLVAFCTERMARFMVPRYVEYRSELPMTETGRVHKFKLRAEGAGDAWDGEAQEARS